MTGCDYMNKRFTVPMSSGRKEDPCLKCGKEIKGVVYKKNGKRHCKECFRAGK